jgi:cadmium resistance transport/sequestration family protein
MPIFISAITAGITAFVATNIDDIVVLMLFFAQSHGSKTTVGAKPMYPWQIVVGQYLGFLVLILASLPGFFGGYILPKPWLGLLGFLPIVIGISYLIKNESPEETVQTISTSDGEPLRPRFAHFLSPQIYQVAAVTIANGGDNIGIYVPLFANSSLVDLIVILLVFAVMVAVWCAIAFYLARHPMVAHLLTRYGHRIVPFVLIGLGIYILLDSETYTLLGLEKVWQK